VIPATRSARGGFTLLEVIVAVSLLALIVVNLSMVLGSGRKSYADTSARMNLEVQAHRAMDRIGLALMGATSESLWTTPSSPNSTDSMNYTMNLGWEGAEEVQSDPERIERVDATSTVRWVQNPESEEERHVTWGNFISDFAEGEIPANAIDDNGNGLIDERGLAFTLDGGSVLVRLTVERPGPEGTTIVRTLERRVTCRN
jgi:prepilin-type N-terminal cleavage/methylation domain-containing protein